MNILTAKNIHKSYGDFKALNNIDLEVPEGAIFGLLGPNGAGKTTLIRIITQIIIADQGTISINGKPLSIEHIREIGYLPEERGLYKKMKVGEHLLYLGQLKGLSKSEAMEQIKIWFKKFEIAGWWNKKVEDLSKGMQQKVQFIVTVLHEPKLLIFDEPFSGFDPINVKLLKEEVLKLRDRGATIIFSTHNMESVEELCDHIALIDKSKKILDGSVNDIKQQYSSKTYRFTYDPIETKITDILDNRFALVTEGKSDSLQYASVQLGEGLMSKDLLSTLTPHLNIHAYNEVIPTMNDIFISVVKENEGR